MKKVVFPKKIRSPKRVKCRKIPGDHNLRFFFDEKSGHPFMSVSKKGDYYFGHEMTTSPELTQSNRIRKCYVKFRKNPNPHNKKKSFYHKRIKQNIFSPKNGRLKPKRNWRISSRDLKILRKIDRRKIKNVRTVKC